MTDEEIQDALESYQREQENVAWDIDCMRAAKPVAWRWKWPDSGLWFATENKLYAALVEKSGTEIEPLYTAPLHPDASEQSDAEPDHASVEMARAKSYAKGFQDGLKAARKVNVAPNPILTQPEPQDSDGVTRKDVDGWMRYFDEHAEEFVAAHEAILRKASR